MELEHIMNKGNMYIYCVQETHLQRDKTFKGEDINASELIEEETGGRVVL